MIIIPHFSYIGCCASFIINYFTQKVHPFDIHCQFKTKGDFCKYAKLHNQQHQIDENPIGKGFLNSGSSFMCFGTTPKFGAIFWRENSLYFPEIWKFVGILRMESLPEIRDFERVLRISSA